MRRGKPNDPARRARILRAALDVIAADGVASASYRRIAAQAGVPLGSTTYYFHDLEALIVCAFESLRADLEPRYAAPLARARTSEEVVDALVAATNGATAPSLADIGLYEEMHRYGARSPAVRALLRELQEESLVVLRRALPDAAARAVDALMWGWWSYRAVHADDALDEGVVRDAYRALVHLGATGPSADEEGDRAGADRSAGQRKSKSTLPLRS